jgi:hypothetical protein
MMEALQNELTMIFTKRGCIHDVSTPRGVFKVSRNIMTDQCLLNVIAWMKLRKMNALSQPELEKYDTLGIRTNEDVKKFMTYVRSVFGENDDDDNNDNDDYDDDDDDDDVDIDDVAVAAVIAADVAADDNDVDVD